MCVRNTQYYGCNIKQIRHGAAHESHQRRVIDRVDRDDSNRRRSPECRLDHTVLGISLFWLVLTVGIVAYVKPGTPVALSQNPVWKYWLGASVVGIAINIAAALLVTTGVVSGDPIRETIPMQFGVMLPWLAIYAGGYLLPAVYRRNSPALNSIERGI